MPSNNPHFSPTLYQALAAASSENPFGIEANRGGGSMFGAASAWLKGRDGEVQRFPTLEKAREEADRLNKSLTTSNVWYVAKPFAEV